MSRPLLDGDLNVGIAGDRNWQGGRSHQIGSDMLCRGGGRSPLFPRRGWILESMIKHLGRAEKPFQGPPLAASLEGCLLAMAKPLNQRGVQYLQNVTSLAAHRVSGITPHEGAECLHAMAKPHGTTGAT